MVGHKVKIQSQQTPFLLVIVARDMICLVVGNKGLVGVRKLVKQDLGSRLILLVHSMQVSSAHFCSSNRHFSTGNCISGNFRWCSLRGSKLIWFLFGDSLIQCLKFDAEVIM